MDPLIIEGPEQSRVDPSLPDGGLPPAVGVQSWCIFRASRDVTDLSDGRGWTYHHHVDMACWKGRLYVGWNSCEKDEDVWPARELFSSSLDGAAWTEPAEMFPQGVSTCLRMYFFLARNGRMLVIAGLRANTGDTSEDRKGGIVVREIRADHSLGEVYTLQSPPAVNQRPPMFEQSSDPGFIDACRQVLADQVFLEQQDLGRLLGKRRMKWHDASSWPGGVVPGDNAKWVCGKAFSFFRRADATLVGVCKMGYVTLSEDDGRSWSQPAIPESLITGKAKVWSQRTADGRWALVYNPSKRQRFPLIAVTSDDGFRFGDMRIIQGELPIQRYEGRFRSIGPQYTRGISHWADDGSRAGENVMWLVYSMSKEDIWVSRVPLPVQADETTTIADDFTRMAAGPIVPGWNTYSPKWAPVAIVDGALRLEDRDPYDHAAATRVFAPGLRHRLSFELSAEQAGSGQLDIDVMGKFGSARPIRLMLTGDGSIRVLNGQRLADLGRYATGQMLAFEIDIDARRQRSSVSLNGQRVLADAAFAEPAEALHRITFRTGEHRGIGGAKPVPPGTDRPHQPVRYAVYRLRIESAQ